MRCAPHTTTHVDGQGFATIRSKGDQALFRLNTQMLKRKMGVPDTRPVADFLPTISIKAKDLANRQKNIQTMTAKPTSYKNCNSSIDKIYVEL